VPRVIPHSLLYHLRPYLVYRFLELHCPPTNAGGDINPQYWLAAGHPSGPPKVEIMLQKNDTGRLTKFPSPSEIERPPGAEGCQDMYPYYAHFSPERREMEDEKLWYFDGMHNPEPLYPFDTIMTENWWVAASQMTNRVWPIPLAKGMDQRI